MSSTELLNPDQTAKRLGRASKTLAKWRVEGRGPKFVRLGSRIMYDAADVEAYIAGLPRHRSTSDTAGE